jgi:hypothetical protein
MPEEEYSHCMTKRLEDNLKEEKERNPELSKNFMMKLVVKSFRYEIFIMVLLGMTTEIIGTMNLF